MENTDELMYSSEAKAAEYLFFSDLNDINIFVEDKGKEYYKLALFC